MNDKSEVEQLEEYTDFDMSEIAEASVLLISLKQYPDYVSDEFNKILDKEIHEQLCKYKNDYKVVEKEENPKPPRKYKELVYVGD